MITSPIRTRSWWRIASYAARAVSVLSTASMCSVSAHAADHLYWTQISNGSEAIVRADLNGANDVVVLSTAGNPSGIVVDAAHPGYFFVAISGTTDQIIKSRLDGSAQELVLNASDPDWIAVDSSAGHIYWSSFETGNEGLRRSNLDGSDTVTLLSGFRPSGIALDQQAGKIYWCSTNVSDPMHVNRIQRANLDGTGIEDIIDGCSFGVALDTSAGKMYWADFSPHRVRRANLDGTDSEDVATDLVLPPVGIALDRVRGKVYWTGASAASGHLHRANLDGSNVELLRSDLKIPVGIAVVSEAEIPAASAWCLVVLSLAVLIVGSLRIGAQRLGGTGVVRHVHGC